MQMKKKVSFDFSTVCITLYICIEYCVYSSLPDQIYVRNSYIA